MKNILPILFGAALLPMAVQATSTSNIVGYLTSTVPAGADLNISIPLLESAEFTSSATDVTGNVIDFPASTFADGTWDTTAHLLTVTDNSLEGRTYLVASDAADQITVSTLVSDPLETQGFTDGDTVLLRKAWTLNTLMPGGVPLGSVADPFNPVNLFFVTPNTGTGLNKSAAASYFHHDGSVLPAGWYKNGDLGAGLQDGLVLPPWNIYTIRNASGSPIDLVNTGEVSGGPVSALVNSDTAANDNVLQLPFPIDTTLAESELFESGAVASSADPFNPVDLVFAYDTTSSGLNPASLAAYFHHDGSVLPAGWYVNGDLGAGLQDNVLNLKGGAILVVRKAVDAGFMADTWKFPLPYTP